MNISIVKSDVNKDSNGDTKNLAEHGKGKVCFDLCGNMYIEYIDKVYQVCIDNTNNIYLDFADYSIINHELIEYGSIITSLWEGSNNTTEDLTTVIDSDSDGEDPDEFMQDENDPYGAVGDKYYIEEKGYMFSVPTLDYETPQFYFCKMSGADELSVNHRKNGDINALYDTFIYKDDKCTFRSKLIGDPPLYVIKVYNGHLNLRDIYDINTSKNYKVLFDGQNINLMTF